MDGAPLRASELLAWLNDLVDTDYGHVESCCDGVAYLQIFDAALGPGKVALDKCNFQPRGADDYVHNLALLSETLRRNGVSRVVAVERLAQGQLADHLEMLRWCYEFVAGYAGGMSGARYNGHERRKQAQTKAARLRGARAEPPSQNATLVPQAARAAAAAGAASQRAPREGADPVAQLKGEMELLADELEVELRERMEQQMRILQELPQLEAEREFYSDKLQSIASVCELHPELEVAAQLSAIISMPDDA